MEMDRKNRHAANPPGKSPSGEPTESTSLPAIEKSPYPELPSHLVIAIDGWAQSGKNSAGEKVAEFLGGVLVDSGRFYRAITKACLNSDVDLADTAAVVAWLQRACLDVRLAREIGGVTEAQVAVNGHWFTKEELKPIGLQTSLIAGIPEVRAMVNTALRMCDCYGRVVMLGRDIGGTVFPATPYKFFLDASEEVREQRHRQSTNQPGAKQRDRYDASRVIYAQKAVLIDTSQLSVEQVSSLIVVEVVWRAAGIKPETSAP